MSLSIAVITPSIPARRELLRECIASVEAQTLRPCVHMVAIDTGGFGCRHLRNQMVRAVDWCDWIAFLDDDDLFDPNHLEVLAPMADNGDIIYSNCRVVGHPENWHPGTRQVQAPTDFDQGNMLPITVLMRRQVFLDLGGFIEDPTLCEDWNLWAKAAHAGMRFRFVNQVTWTYDLNRRLSRK